MSTPGLPEPYRPERLLGEGGTGHVWLAWDGRLKIPVAVKIVRSNLARYARFRARFAREVALSVQIQHPRLVPVYDFGTLPDGLPYVVMGYADQGSLAQLLRWGPPLTEVLRIVDQVLEALSILHAHGLVHQDLKPENILLYNDDQGAVNAWVSDLGVAGTFAELAMERRGISGTPIWMAPEQLSRRPQELGPWTDLFALGLMLYEILGGEPTPENLGQSQLIARRTRSPISLSADVPDAVAQIVGRLLAPDPRQRYDRAADVRRALRDAARRLGEERIAQSNGEPHNQGSTVFPVQQTLTGEPAMTPLPEATPSTVPRWNRVAPDPIPPTPPMPYRPQPPRASLSLLSRRSPPLMGRTAQQQALWQRARAVVRQQRPQVVLVIGPAGSGKGALVHDVAVSLDAGGFMEVIRLAYHRPSNTQDGYAGAVREMLAPWHDTREQMEIRLQRWLSRDRQATIQSTEAEAAILTRWAGHARTDEPPINAAVGLAFLYRHLDARAWRGGAMLLMEHVHRAQAEGDGLQICEALLDYSVGRRPVLVVATLSQEAFERDAALRAKIDALMRQGALLMALPPLSSAEMRRELEDALSLHPELAAMLSEQSRGTPADAALLLRDWSTRGLLIQGDDLRIRPSASLRTMPAPTSLDALARQRINGALSAAEDPQAAADALALTALAGQAPPVSLLRSINADGLDSLFATGLIRQRGWRLRFEHGSVQRAAQQMSEARTDRAALHRKLADAWAAFGEQTGINVDLEEGRQRLMAKQPDAALSPLLRAARDAHETGRAALALDAARPAIRAADQSNRLMGRFDARCQAIDALLSLHRPREAMAMIQATTQLGRLDRRTSAQLRIREARTARALNRPDDARRALREAEAAFLATNDRMGLLDVHREQGRLAEQAGHPQLAMIHFERMLDINQRRDPRLEAHALTGLIDACIDADRPEQLDKMTRRLKRIARRSGDTRDIARSTYAAGRVHLYHARLDDAEQHFHTARALAATLGADRLRFDCLCCLGTVYQRRQDNRRARHRFDRAVRFAEERRWNGEAAEARMRLALLHLASGDDNLARDEVDAAEQLLAQDDQHPTWRLIGLLRAVWAAEDADEVTCQAWWAVSTARGLAQHRDPDLWLPLQRLHVAADFHEWSEIAQRANQFAQTVHIDPADVRGDGSARTAGSET
ncbi:MAG: protein kinase [Myxococcota bacterium]